jgi:hypothetical protein
LFEKEGKQHAGCLPRFMVIVGSPDEIKGFAEVIWRAAEFIYDKPEKFISLIKKFSVPHGRRTPFAVKISWIFLSYQHHERGTASLMHHK